MSSTLVDEVLPPVEPTHDQTTMDQTTRDQTQADRISIRSFTVSQKRSVDVGVDSVVSSKITNLDIFMMLIILALTIVALYQFLHTVQCKPANQSSSNLKEVCQTKECVHAAARIDSSLDYETRPCDDFYQFACGGWLKQNVPSKAKPVISKYTQLNDRVERIVNDFLKEEIKNKDLSSIKKAKTLYASCMNRGLVRKLGLRPLKKIITEEFGGWPLTTDFWNESDFNLETTMKKLHDYRVSSFFDLVVRIDQRNRSQRVLTIEEPHLSLPFFMSYQELRISYQLESLERDIFNIGSLFGIASVWNGSHEAESIVDFEYRLAAIMVSAKENISKIITLDKLQKDFNQTFNWTAYLTSILSTPEAAVTDFTGNVVIMSRYPNYLQLLAGLLGQTSARTIANYLVWKFIDMCLCEGLVGGNVVQRYKYKATKQQIYHEELSKECLDYTTKALGQAVGRMFVRETFHDETRILISNMIKSFQEVYDEMFENLDWMDKQTKVAAKEKNAYMKSVIGYQPELDNDTYLDSLYSHLAFNKDTFLENILTIRKQEVTTEFMKLMSPVETDKWLVSPQGISSVFERNKNYMVIPAGALISPFLNKKEPKSLLFGSVGNIIGHEIAHSFDDLGGQYDKYGNKSTWWSSSVIDQFKQRSKCLVDQYGNFTNDNNMNINGVLTRRENFADNVALKQAYKVYRRLVEGKEEPLLPSLPFTHDQLYFISHAQIGCEKDTPAAVQLFSPFETHAPGRLRVNGPVQNSKEFSEAFQCPVGSMMNPAAKCNFW